jgi:single-strand DNA-binding protein
MYQGREINMIEDQQLTIAGTVGGDPELRFTPSGAAVVNFSVAVNHRRFNKATQTWDEDGTDWWRCTAWRQPAENIAESFHRGDRVIVVGRVKSRQWETREGQKITSWEITVDEAGPSTKWATTVQNKADRTTAPQGQYGGQQGGQQGGQYRQSAPPEDPWATSAPGQGSGGYGGFADEPPF